MLSEEKKESEVEAKTTEDTSSENATMDETVKLQSKAVEKAELSEDAIAKAETAAKAVEEAELAVKEALAKAEAAKAEAEVAAEEEYKAIAAEVKADATTKPVHTFKRQGEEIFRRDMDEPEFWLDKSDRFPRPILSADEQESLTRQAEIYRDYTPAYVPEHVLSPEFAGVSNYERGVDSFLEETKQKLEQLKNNPDATKKEIKETEDEIIYLESLHENYYIGMNVFRTAKGGRGKIKA